MVHSELQGPVFRSPGGHLALYLGLQEAIWPCTAPGIGHMALYGTWYRPYGPILTLFHAVYGPILTLFHAVYGPYLT